MEPPAVGRKPGGGAGAGTWNGIRFRSGAGRRSRLSGPRGPGRLLLFLAAACFRRPRACLALLALATLALGSRLPTLELHTDGAALHPRDHPATERTLRDRNLFQDPEELIVLVTARPEGPVLTSTAGLRGLAALHGELAALPAVQADGVRSAAGLVDVASSGLVSLGTYLDDVPDDDAAREALLGRMREQPWTGGLFLSTDGRAAVLYAPLEPGADRRHRLEEVERWLEIRNGKPFELRLTGPVVAEALLGERVLADLARLVPCMVLVVTVLLLVFLRTVGGLLLAMVKTLLVLVWTGGLMALAGIPVTLVTTVLPVLLMALCVTDEVHVVSRFQQAWWGAPRSSERGDLLLATLEELHPPVVYTSISTAIGFLSFLGASIVPLRHFGLLAAVGILLAMLMTFTLTPALVGLLPGSWFGPPAMRRGNRFGAVGQVGAAGPLRSWMASGRRRTLGLGVGLLLLVAGVPGLLRLTVQDSWIDNFDSGSPLVQAERELNRRFWGAWRLDLVLSGRPGDFHTPEGAALVAAATSLVAAGPHVGGVVTPLHPLDQVAELLGLYADARSLPPDALEAVVRVASEYPERSGLHRLLTPDGRAARLLVLVNSPDSRKAADLVEHVERELPLLLRGMPPPGGPEKGTDLAWHASGDLPLALATVEAVVEDQLQSIAWTLAGVGLLLFLVNRDPWLTVVQVVPPAAAAWLILAGMGYAGMSLGVATSMFTALTLGIGIDLALHVTSAWGQQRAGGRTGAQAVSAAFARTSTGRRGSTVVLAAGFLVLTVSAFSPNRDLGLLLCAAMLASYLATSLFIPRMLAS